MPRTIRDELWARVCPDTGRVSFRGQTDAVTGAQLLTFLDAHSAPRGSTGPDGTRSPDRRTPANRRGHALADLVRLAVNADPAVSGGLGVQLIVIASLATLQARLGQTGVGCATAETGQPLSAATTRLLACAATVIPAVLGANGEPLDIGRATRAIPPAVRRALVVRDRGCAFPGCRRPPRWADAHHIQHWADGGATSLDNLVLLCGHHHDVIHHTPWSVLVVDGRPVFTPPVAVLDDQAPRGPTPDRAA